MKGAIFLIQDNGELVEMTEHEYDSEELLQKLLAKYPSLLAGDQVDSASPRRWLLISRELPVPDEEGGSGRWSLDHLFLDQDGIPTLVEVKRSSDTRIRREVIGQMLDYAANAVLYWPIETIRRELESRCEKDGRNPEEELRELLGDDADPEQFWESVKTNLKAGKIRLVFVADEIPSELQRIVEFLNGQMDPAEVLAVEIKQYMGQELKTLVPRVIGQTADAQTAKKRRKPPRDWDKPSFLADIKSRQGEKEVEIAEKALRWAESNSLDVKWGRGATYGTFSPILNHKGKANDLFGVSTSGKIEVVFGDHAPEAEDQKKEFFSRLNSLTGVSLPDKAIDTWAGFPLAVLTDEHNSERFFEIFEWVIEQIKTS